MKLEITRDLGTTRYVFTSDFPVEYVDGSILFIQVSKCI